MSISGAVFSFILCDIQPEQLLRRFILSLQHQDIPAHRVELWFLEAHAQQTTARLLRNIERQGNGWHIRLAHAKGTDYTARSRAVQKAMQESRGLLTACVRPGVRLDREFMSQHLTALKQRPEADILFSDGLLLETNHDLPHPRTGPTTQQLRRFNAIGPLPVMTRKARRLCRWFASSPFPAWELGIQAAQRGLRFHRIRYPLYSMNVAGRLSRCSPDNMARLILRQSGFFLPDQVCWALNVLRCHSWATAYTGTVLPDSKDVRALLEQSVRDQRTPSPDVAKIPLHDLAPALGA